jgi:hypothetical protein
MLFVRISPCKKIYHSVLHSGNLVESRRRRVRRRDNRSGRYFGDSVSALAILGIYCDMKDILGLVEMMYYR